MTSMTGHGRGVAREGAWSVVVECHSVNRKTAEVVVHHDRGSSGIEPLVRERVLASISRGRVQVNVAVKMESSNSADFFDEDRAVKFVRQAEKLRKKLGLAGDITLSDVLSAPGVVRIEESVGEPSEEVVIKALDKALEGMVAMRRREGEALRKTFEKSLSRLESVLRKISPLAGRVAKLQRESLLRRISKARLEAMPDENRLAAEVAIFAERSDITEELERAGSHIAQFREKLDGKGPVGRSLEFLTQELGREFNTLGAKSTLAETTKLVIEAKTELERVREQLANIE